MQPAALLEQLIEYLDQHIAGLRGALGQEPYKGDLFKLFTIAYRQGYMDLSSSPRLTGDAIRDRILARWNPGDDDKGTQQRQLLDRVCSIWDEWGYALDHYR